MRTRLALTLLALLLAWPSAARADETARAADGPQLVSGFAFGSYGRVAAATDLEGSTPEAATVVAHGPRIVEPSYVELDLRYRTQAAGPFDVRTVATVALLGEPFHYTGDFDARLAIRNLYAEAAVGGYGFWVGSRMYRGDDIYLLDYWPLDNLNTLGGGAWLLIDRLEAGLHVGVNRLLDPYQQQAIQVVARDYGATEIPLLDRQRMVASAKASYRFLGDGAGPSAKVKVYGELHSVPQGVHELEDGTRELLPADLGLTVGAQLGAWGYAHGPSHVNLFGRLSLGLAAHGEMGVPADVDASLKAWPEASELVLGLSANHEIARAGVLVGGYLRRFQDADPDHADFDDAWEWVIDARPYAAILPALQVAVDLSYQQRLPDGPSPTELVLLDAGVWQIAPMVLLTPGGPGSYARPQLRLVYRVAHLDEGARDLYPPEDLRRGHEWTHYLGAQAEWWFNSSYR